VSAVALVAIGAAGWLLQKHTADEQTRTARQEREERLYLPMLRSLSDTELALSAIDDALSVPIATRAGRYQQGVILRDLAHAIFLPDGDPMAHFQKIGDIGYIDYGETTAAPLRATALMFADILRHSELFEHVGEHPSFSLDAESDRLTVHYDNGVVRLTVTPEAFAAWRAFLTTGDMNIHALQKDPRFYVRVLRGALEYTIHDVLSHHRLLGDRYVTIRHEAVTDYV
jgi:hypothetical protein